MRKFKRLTLTLALLIMAVGGAWATEFTSLKVGDVLHVGDVINTGTNYTVCDGSLDAGFQPATLVRANIGTHDITESETGAYYLLKLQIGIYSGVISGDEGNEGGHWPVTDTSDGLSVTAITPGDYYTELTFAVHESEITEWSLTPDETGKTWTLAKMPASNIELQVEYEPTKVTMAANDNAMGTVEVASGSKVEWTADTWKGWNYDTKEYTVDDITMTSSKEAYIYEYTDEGMYKNSLSFFVDKWDNTSNVTFSTTGDPFSRIEFTMIADYEADWNPNILPTDGWTFEGKSAVWEGEATKSLTLQSCTTDVSKITFYKGDGEIPDGVTVNGDGTFTVAKTATVKLKATPAEGYKFLYWEDDQTNTNPVREVTIESGMADKTYKAVFAEILYNVTFVEGTNLDEWTATPNPAKTKQNVTVTYTGSKKVIGVKAEKKEAPAETTVTLTTGEIGDLSSWGSNSKTINGITIAVSGDAQFYSTGLMDVHGDAGPEPDPDQVYAVGTFTFTSSAGKIKRIDINHNGGNWWGSGDGWPGSYQVYDNSTFTWSGTPAASVTLNGSHKGFEFCALYDVSSIVFTIEPTN